MTCVDCTYCISCSLDNEKSARRDTNTALAVVMQSQKNFAPLQTSSRGAGRPKFNQLEMVTTFT